MKLNLIHVREAFAFAQALEAHCQCKVEVKLAVDGVYVHTNTRRGDRVKTFIAYSELEASKANLLLKTIKRQQADLAL